LGGNFPTSVAARKSITAWSHFPMENSSETCTCRHLPALQPVAFPTAFQNTVRSFPRRCKSGHSVRCKVRKVNPEVLTDIFKNPSIVHPNTMLLPLSHPIQRKYPPTVKNTKSSPFSVRNAIPQRHAQLRTPAGSHPLSSAP
jgi:hypothetical protein